MCKVSIQVNLDDSSSLVKANKVLEAIKDIMGDVEVSQPVVKSAEEAFAGKPAESATDVTTQSQESTTGTSAPLQGAVAREDDVEIDKEGTPWDERIHSSSKKKTAKGVWSRRRNIPDDVFNRVKAEITGGVTSEPAVPTPPPVVEQTSVPTPPAVLVEQTSVPTPPPVVETASDDELDVTAEDLVSEITGNVQLGVISLDTVMNELVMVGVANLMALKEVTDQATLDALWDKLVEVE